VFVGRKYWISTSEPALVLTVQHLHIGHWHEGWSVSYHKCTWNYLLIVSTSMCLTGVQHHLLGTSAIYWIHTAKTHLDIVTQ